MSELFKLLVEGGLSPMLAILVIAIVILGLVVKFIYNKQNTVTEAWQKDTKEQLDKAIADRQSDFIESQRRFSELNQHFENCDSDRTALKDQVNKLDARIQVIELCPKKEDCPFRKA